MLCLCYFQVCNHPRLCYADSEHFWEQNVVRTCGKMYWLDQILVKLYSTGHRVLLFSTMTRMLDTVEFYLNWRKVRNAHVQAYHLHTHTTYTHTHSRVCTGP